MTRNVTPNAAQRDDPDAPKQKRCNRCREIQPLSAFHKIPKDVRADGRQTICKDCARAKRGQSRHIREGRFSKSREKLKAKRCNDCGVVKPLKQFWKASRIASGYVPYCGDCGARRRKNQVTLNRAKHEADLKIECPVCKYETVMTDPEIDRERGFCSQCNARFTFDPVLKTVREQLTDARILTPDKALVLMYRSFLGDRARRRELAASFETRQDRAESYEYHRAIENEEILQGGKF